MAKPNFNQEFAVTVLLEAIFATDQKACEKFGITDRTLRNYKKRLQTDEEFSAFFRNRKKVFDSQWAEDLNPALRSSIRTIESIAKKIEADSVVWKNPRTLEALARATEVVGEIALTVRVFDAQLGAENSTAERLSGEKSAASDGESSAFIN